MPYQVKVGTVITVVPTLAKAIEMFDKIDDPDRTIRDMDGKELSVERLRPILNENEPS